LKRDYRRFAIQTLTQPDDYAAMREVLTRRFRRYLDGDEKFRQLPDLLLIDGGEMHARAAQEALHSLGLDLPILGMVKDDKHRTRALVTAEGAELGISQSPHIFALIGRIQEETHRFALTFQQQKRKKRTFRSRLDGVTGLGPERKKALMKHFGTVRAVESATEAELAQVLPATVANTLWKHLHKE
jgi:excinuclease ABC subunit C